LVTMFTYNNKITVAEGKKSLHFWIRKTVKISDTVEGLNPDSVLRICEQ
jgi:hypothetical protein